MRSLDRVIAERHRRRMQEKRAREDSRRRTSLHGNPMDKLLHVVHKIEPLEDKQLITIRKSTS